VLVIVHRKVHLVSPASEPQITLLPLLERAQVVQIAMVLERADQRALRWLVQVLIQKVHHQWEPVPEHQITHLHLLQMHSVWVL
jgi:hypothetical protein